MKTLFLLVLSCSVLLFSGCAEDSGGGRVAAKAAAFAESPAGKTLANTFIDAAQASAGQYISTGTVDTRIVARNILDGAADGLRSQVNTPSSTSAKAIVKSVTEGAGRASVKETVAPIVVGEVTKQVQGGVDPDLALENVATVMNVAAAKVVAKSRPKKP